MISPHTRKPTMSAAITDPVHSSRTWVASSVTPSGKPKRQNSLLRSHPVRLSTPRRPSAATRASLLRRATARCLLVLRPDDPDGLPRLGVCRGPAHGDPADHSVGRDYRTPLGGPPPLGREDRKSVV